MNAARPSAKAIDFEIGSGQNPPMNQKSATPYIIFAGFSGAGKTTLLEQVITILSQRGVRLGLLKHAHHDFDVDIPGKDSWRHRKAGAREVLVASSQRWALMHEHGDDSEPSLEELMAHLSPCDLILVEGWKGAAGPKVEIWREENGKPIILDHDPHRIALVSDRIPEGFEGCWLDLNSPIMVADFLMEYSGLSR
jgi:molybdopterin-guanine dinucleotide biosynthesis protein B